MGNEPIKLKLPVSGGEAIIRPYATGRVVQAIQAALFGDSAIKTHIKAGEEGQADPKDAQQDVELKMSNINDSRNAAISAMVISINGSEDNVLDAVLDLPEDDYNAVVAKVDELTKRSTVSNKKK